MSLDLDQIIQGGAVGISVLLIVGFIYMFNQMRSQFLNYIDKREESHDKTYCALKKSIDKNTKVSEETYTYLKMKNGSMEKMFEDVKGLKGDKGEKGERGERG